MYMVAGVIVCAPEDVDFATQIKNALQRHNITTHVCSKLSDWNEHEKEYALFSTTTQSA